MHTQCNNYDSNMYTHTDHRYIWCLCINEHILRMSHVQSPNTKLYNM